MSVVILLIAAGGTVAAGFLVALLRDDRTASTIDQHSETHDHHNC